METLLPYSHLICCDEKDVTGCMGEVTIVVQPQKCGVK
jgi:hypothetical protein